VRIVATIAAVMLVRMEISYDLNKATLVDTFRGWVPEMAPCGLVRMVSP
jgi:hypothetical protein